MSTKTDFRDPYGYEEYKRNSGQEWSLNVTQQKALNEFAVDMGKTIFEGFIPLTNRFQLGEISKEEFLKEQTRLVRNLRKYWSYVMDNFNTLGEEEK